LRITPNGGQGFRLEQADITRKHCSLNLREARMARARAKQFCQSPGSTPSGKNQIKSTFAKATYYSVTKTVTPFTYLA